MNTKTEVAIENIIETHLNSTFTIEAIAPGALYDLVGLQIGDTIVGLNNRAILSRRDQISGETWHTIDLIRQGAFVQIVLSDETKASIETWKTAYAAHNRAAIEAQIARGGPVPKLIKLSDK